MVRRRLNSDVERAGGRRDVIPLRYRLFGNQISKVPTLVRMVADKFPEIAGAYMSSKVVPKGMDQKEVNTLIRLAAKGAEMVGRAEGKLDEHFEVEDSPSPSVVVLNNKRKTMSSSSSHNRHDSKIRRITGPSKSVDLTVKPPWAGPGRPVTHLPEHTDRPFPVERRGSGRWDIDAPGGGQEAYNPFPEFSPPWWERYHKNEEWFGRRKWIIGDPHNRSKHPSQRLPFGYKVPYPVPKSMVRRYKKKTTKKSRKSGGRIGTRMIRGSGGYSMGPLVNRILSDPGYKSSRFTVSSNALVNKDELPQFSTGKGAGAGSLIAHREYIQDVVSSSTAGLFNLNSFEINPGLSSTFPWLSYVAAQYEEYVVRGMVFEYKSTSCDALNSTNTALGTVIMATEYNAAAANFASKQQMENYEYAQSCKPSQSMFHAIECKRSANPISELYVRTGGVPSGQDERLYDLGNFQIATVGMQGTSVNIGELWVTYLIELKKPKLGGLGALIPNYHNAWTTGCGTSHYFGTAGSTLNLGLTGLTASTGTVTFPAYITSGNWLIMWGVVTTSSASVAPTISAGTNCTALAILDGETASNYVAPFNAGTQQTSLVSVAIITITGASATVTFSGATLTSVGAGDLIITQLNTALIS